jgi:hypothetical protein
MRFSVRMRAVPPAEARAWREERAARERRELDVLLDGDGAVELEPPTPQDARSPAPAGAVAEPSTHIPLRSAPAASPAASPAAALPAPASPAEVEAREPPREPRKFEHVLIVEVRGPRRPR